MTAKPLPTPGLQIATQLTPQSTIAGPAMAQIAPAPAPTSQQGPAIAIKDSRVGVPYQRFSELMTRGQLELKYLEFQEHKAQNSAALDAIRGRLGAGVNHTEIYQRLSATLPARDDLLATPVAEVAARRQQIQGLLAECDGELRYLYHLYIDECIDIEVTRVREQLMALPV
jgi:hypothetical protein